jgi:hypothetical protein
LYYHVDTPIEYRLVSAMLASQNKVHNIHGAMPVDRGGKLHLRCLATEQETLVREGEKHALRTALFEIGLWPPKHR